MSENINAIEVNGLTKVFGSVIANDHINLRARKGEILALLGENGSGKTTLMNMLSGIYQPDAGSIFIEGKPVTIKSPKEAFNHGIGMIHQHFKLVDVFTARENILLGNPTTYKGEAGPDLLCQRFGLAVDLDKKIYDMSVGEKQTVEIIKVLTRGADILILDEPTAVLTPQEIDKLFVILRNMRDEGKTILIITHKLDEVLSISDYVTVLHKGKSVGSIKTSEADKFLLTEMMVGRKVDLEVKHQPTQIGEPLLDVHQLVVLSKEGNKLLDKVSFELFEGEILGVAGVSGSGQKELCEAIAGLEKIEGGSILMDGKRIDGLTPREILQRGVTMAFIPEDRLGMGLVGSMNIPDNLLLKTYNESKGPFLSKKNAKEEAAKLVEQLAVVTPNLTTPVQKLSGGNVQKVLLGREINLSPRVLITAYPVRGLDIGASMMIYDMLNEQKKKGIGVLFIGEDLDVLLTLCDRIMVLSGGKVTAILPAKFATKTLLGMKMTGIQTDKEDDYA